MTGTIFLRQPDGSLAHLEGQPYALEDDLQTLIADYPNLLAGDQMSAEARRWLLVRREMGVPGESGGGDRWSVDHLFLDQSGVPTLVEVKRSSDTRIRREVVGQMLDYAANAVGYWPLANVQSRYQQECDSRGLDPDECIRKFLGDGTDEELVERFWQNVKTNLQAGRVRMVFVADVIPPELQRIVEFLNEQMDPAEVLAVEIGQFVGNGLQALVPRLVGRTAQAEIRKSTATESTTWDEESFFAELAKNVAASEVAVARRIYDALLPRTSSVQWGKGKFDGNVLPMYTDVRGKQWVVSLSTNGSFSIPFGWMRNYAPFSSEELRRNLLERLNGLNDIELPGDAIEKWPSLRYEQFVAAGRLDALVDVLLWGVEQIIRTRPAP